MVQDEKSGIIKMITIHPEGVINVCSNFHGKPSNNRQDISLLYKNVNLMVVKGKSQGITKVNHPLGMWLQT